MLFYDTEASFLRKGFKRKDTQLFEIGMVRGRKTFQCMVNPVGTKPPFETLQKLGQHPENSIRFWTKLLSEKGYLNTAVRRLPPKEQSERIAKVIQHADFLTPETAIRRAYAFGKNDMWIAHNGRAFDEKIICAHLTRANITHTITFKDSLHMLRKQLDLPSYSQPKVYKALFKETYKAHHALEDARALQRICKRAGIVALLMPLLPLYQRRDMEKAPRKARSPPEVVVSVPAAPPLPPSRSIPVTPPRRPRGPKAFVKGRSRPSNRPKVLASSPSTPQSVPQNSSAKTVETT